MENALAEHIPAEWFEEVRKRASEALQPHCLEMTNPEKAARVLWLLSQGRTKLSIAREVGVDRETVGRLAWTHNDTLESKRQYFSRKFALAAESATDLLMKKIDQLEDDPEALKGVSPEKLALTAGIMTDKSAMLAGMPSITIEHKRGVTIQDAMEYQAKVREQLAKRLVVEAEVVAVEAS